MCDRSWIDGKAEDQAVKAAISGCGDRGNRQQWGQDGGSGKRVCDRLLHFAG